MESDDREKRPAVRPAPTPASADRLALCARLAAAALVLPLLAAGLLGLFLELKAPSTGPAKRYLRALCLDRPAWFPSGRLERHPTMRHPGVPLRHAPRLPRAEEPVRPLPPSAAGDDGKLP